MCKILDKIDNKGVMFVEQNMGKVTFYEVYKKVGRDYTRLTSIKNDFNKALAEYTQCIADM
jgi:hypothetical protein